MNQLDIIILNLLKRLPNSVLISPKLTSRNNNSDHSFFLTRNLPGQIAKAPIKIFFVITIQDLGNHCQKMDAFLINDTHRQFAKIDALSNKAFMTSSVELILNLIHKLTWDIADDIKLIERVDVSTSQLGYVNVADEGNHLSDHFNPTTKRVSPYNEFMKKELARIKAQDPLIAHKVAFKMTAQNWKIRQETLFGWEIS